MTDPARRPRPSGTLPPTMAGPSAPDALGVLELLKLEGELRGAATLHELQIALANLPRGLMRARQIFVAALPAKSAPRIVAASGLPAVDRNVPLIQWIERTLQRLQAEAGPAAPTPFLLHAYTGDDDPGGRAFPFAEALWIPLRRRDRTAFAGLLLTRETPWREADLVLAGRLGDTAAHAWLALAVAPRALFRFNRTRAAIVAGLVVAAGFVPVPMTTLAPFEIAPREPYLVTAPIDGVIEDILVDANAEIASGRPLLRFVDTTLRSRFTVAEREVQVAEARVKKMSLLAFADVRGRHEFGIALAELSVKRTERDLAREVLGRTTVAAPRAGVAVFGDKRDLVGRPVSVGEKLLEIADPGRVEVRIDVPVGDSIILAEGARVAAFLDSDPLNPLQATVVRADYQAKPHEGGTMSFRVVAAFTDASRPAPRLGIRGTAQLHGATVTLAFYLLRRPIAAARQWIGF